MAGSTAPPNSSDSCGRRGSGTRRRCHYTLQQNGVAESRNRMVQQMATAMLSDSGLPKLFWVEATLTAIEIQNRILATATGTTPYQRWTRKKPTISYFRAFGCAVYALKPDQKWTKFGNQGGEVRDAGVPRGDEGVPPLESGAPMQIQTLL